MTAADELELETLIADLKKLENSVVHLNRSNRELEDALEMTPGDEDFISAIAENKGLIVKRQKDIEELKKLMKALEDRTRPPSYLPTPPPSTQEGTGPRPPARPSAGSLEIGRQTPGLAQGGVQRGQEGDDGPQLDEQGGVFL